MEWFAVVLSNNLSINCVTTWVLPTDLDQRFKNLHHFLPAWGSNWGYLGFSHDQSNADSSGAYVTCIYCGLSVQINMREIPHGAQSSWVHFDCVCFCMCGQQKSKYPQLELHGCRRHYTGWYRRSGISGLNL